MAQSQTLMSDTPTFNDVAGSIIETQVPTLPGFLATIFYIVGLILLLSLPLYLLFPQIYSGSSKLKIPKSLQAVAKPLVIWLTALFLGLYFLNLLNFGPQPYIIVPLALLGISIQGLLKLRKLNSNLTSQKMIYVGMVLIMAITGILYPLSIGLSILYRRKNNPDYKIEFHYLLKCFAIGISVFSIPFWIEKFL